MAVAATDADFAQAQRVVRDFVCGECGAGLTTLNVAGRWLDACSADRSHQARTSHTEVHKAEIRDRLEADPATKNALTLQGSVPMTGLAIRELDDRKLLARIPAKYGYGNDMAVTPELRLQIAQAARIYGLDPLFHLMVYSGRLYVTYEGRLSKLKEHPNLLPPKTRFLKADEKEEMGLEPTDLVVECTIVDRNGGEYVDYGFVRRSEIDDALAKAKADSKRPAPVAVKSQEIALKRAIARCSRQAAGLDLPTYDGAAGTGQVIEGEAREISTTVESPRSPDDAARGRFWAVADELGVTREQVHDYLQVQTLTGYAGGWARAEADLRAAVQARWDGIDQTSAPEHESQEPPEAAIDGEYSEQPAEEPSGEPAEDERSDEELHVRAKELLRLLAAPPFRISLNAPPADAPRAALVAAVHGLEQRYQQENAKVDQREAKRR